MDDEIKKFKEFWKDVDTGMMFSNEKTIDGITRTQVNLVLPRRCEYEHEFIQDFVSTCFAKYLQLHKDKIQ